MDFEDHTLDELKSLAYDLIVQQSQSEQQLEAVQQEIASRQQENVDLDVETDEDSDEGEE